MFPPSTTSSILAFATVAAVLVLTPGVGTTFLTATVITNGRRAGYLTALGMVVGSAVHATIAIAGTAILLRQFPQALSWIAIGGGTVIIWLGGRGIVRAVGSPNPQLMPIAVERGEHTWIGAGLLVALGNAPIPLFYFVVVPQDIPSGISRVVGAALLSTIHLVMAGVWMATLVTLLGRLLALLRRPKVLTALQLATGLTLLFLGFQSIVGALRLPIAGQ